MTSPAPLPPRNLALRGPLLLPHPSLDDTFTYTPDALLTTDSLGLLTFAGEYDHRPARLASITPEPVSLLIPPLLDCHIHIPQHPIRGRFLEGVRLDLETGSLLQGLEHNVYPAEGRCADLEYSLDCSRQFLAETRSQGTLGGVAYMTTHPVAVRAALQTLPPTWRVGLVLMDQNCPPALSITPSEASVALDTLAREFGSRLLVTDRFAVACSSHLRQAGVALARKHGLETQTHLAEQLAELQTIARLYPDAPHYTAIYDRDGLLSPGCIAAHCIHLSHPEWQLLAARKTRVAHCPVSNTLLGSGTMPLDQVYAHHIDYALCTDVGASPTTSLLAEAAHFLSVHEGRSDRATPSAALWRATVGARRVGKIAIGGLTLGEPFAAIELRLPPSPAPSYPPSLLPDFLTVTPDQIIRQALSPYSPTPPSLTSPVPSPVLRTWA